MHRNRRGFTLIEAVIAMAIAGILLGVAVPAWQDAMARSRASAARGELMATWTVAVGHAARTGTEVVLCPSAGVECRNSFDWSEGWIAFADIDGNRRRAPGETLVDVADALHDSVRLRSTTGRRRLVVQRRQCRLERHVQPVRPPWRRPGRDPRAGEHRPVARRHAVAEGRERVRCRAALNSGAATSPTGNPRRPPGTCSGCCRCPCTRTPRSARSPTACRTSCR